ncbi:MAG: hypothetical protein ACRD9L_22600 [Bryobacteraceae bacterium]
MYTKLFVVPILLSGAVFAQDMYQGPEILSRGGMDIGQRSGRAVDLRFFASVNGVYDTGFTPASVDSNGKIVDLGGVFGLQADLGLYGTHSWQRSVLGINYRGDYRDYARDHSQNGSDHQLELKFEHQFSGHMSVMLREAAGTASYAFGAGNYSSPFNPFIAVPTDQIFDTRVTFGQSGVDLVYQKNPRLSFSFGGDGFAVRHQSAGLVGLNGYMAHGDVAYRLSRRSTVSVDYNYSHFEYEGLFGSSDIHTVAAAYSKTLTRRWQASLRAGVVVVQTKGLGSVAVDPAVAAILGQTTTISAFYITGLLPILEARLHGQFQHSSLEFRAEQSTTPGNGVYLTSKTQAAGVNYSYTGIRRWNFGLHGYYSKLASLGQQIGAYNAYTAGAGGTYSLSRSTHLIVELEGRRYDIGGQSGVLVPFRQNSYRVSVGVGFSPGTIPLSIW